MLAQSFTLDSLQNEQIQYLPEQQFTITAYGFQSTTGKSGFGLHSAVNAKSMQSLRAAFQPLYLVSDEINDHTANEPVAGFNNIAPDYRLFLCLQGSILDATDYLMEHGLNHQNHIVFIVLPSCDYYQRYRINTSDWLEYLVNTLDQFSGLDIRFLNSDDNIDKKLNDAYKQLKSGSVNSIIFSGIESQAGVTKQFKDQNPTESVATVIIQKTQSESSLLLSTIQTNVN